MFMGSNVLTALAGTIFPEIISGSDTTSSSPAGSPAREIDIERPVVLHLPSQVGDSYYSYLLNICVLRFYFIFSVPVFF